MKYSLYRIVDIVEVFILYLICFSVNLIFIYISRLSLEKVLILKNFLQSISDYKYIFIIFLTFMLIIFNYQFINKKKSEIYCRVIVGDTIKKIRKKYILDSIIILTLSFMVSLFISLYLNISITSNIYIYLIFVMYTIIVSIKVKKI